MKQSGLSYWKRTHPPALVFTAVCVCVGAGPKTRRVRFFRHVVGDAAALGEDDSTHDARALVRLCHERTA